MCLVKELRLRQFLFLFTIQQPTWNLAFHLSHTYLVLRNVPVDEKGDQELGICSCKQNRTR